MRASRIYAVLILRLILLILLVLVLILVLVLLLLLLLLFQELLGVDIVELSLLIRRVEPHSRLIGLQSLLQLLLLELSIAQVVVDIGPLRVGHSHTLTLQQPVEGALGRGVVAHSILRIAQVEGRLQGE